MQAAPFITFWSAHGGVGRTLAVLGVGRVLAARGLRVLLVDADLEAPGLSRLVGGDGDGLVELMTAGVPEAAAMAGCCATIAGTLRVLRAGRLDAAYWDRLDAWPQGERAAALHELRRRIDTAEIADVVLVDGPPGLSRATERVVRALADRVVVLTAINQQQVAGTAELLRRCRAAELPARVVYGPLPLGEDELTAAREEAARVAFADEALALSGPIPQHPRLALHEQASERGPVHAAHVALARELLVDAGFEVRALLRGVEAAIEAQAWARALALLRVAIVIEPTGASLGSLFPRLREHMTPAAASDPLFALLAEALPVDSPRLASFATALHSAGNPLARRFYEKFLADAPDHADMLGNFAAFLSDVCGEHDLAEAYYEQALAAAPDDADHLGNFANFQALVRGDRARADACYQATIAAAPDDAHHLGNYANFRVATFADVAGAEALYRRALAADPEDANLLGNFARLLFAEGRGAEGRELLARALELSEAGSPLRCELCFYAYAHAPEVVPDALAQLREMLASGVRSPGWELVANVARVRLDGHAEPELLATLARVIADEAPLAALDAFVAWVRSSE
ncbi:KGGVGR-motif variant AAA ATPase [Nannocystis radixulma]|uniref:AAA family ATPase n=1 Tax=Nannocystis radixulma TaxID=2995305 RepID=A0ABT5BKC6_9BACT|nr:tetratricopeptide repeat protein [Nannocystis radixulma]MDC0674608.1 AAA family ATPase [Nannocystis radixulma]